MLLDRSKPKVNEGFGDYLEDLGERNGFRDLNRFKVFLRKQGKKKYRVQSKFNGMFALISGLFFELGLDKRQDSNGERTVCFMCLNSFPERWDWQMVPLNRCDQLFDFTGTDKESEVIRTRKCGLVLCTTERLGLSYSSKKAGLFFAGMHSKNECVKLGKTLYMYPKHDAFTQVR